MFVKEKLNDHLFRIIDQSKVCCYLVTGKERALLLDTCSGVGNIREYIENFCFLPLTVILTHGHFDHAGAASLFEDVYMNLKDVDCYYNGEKDLKELFYQNVSKLLPEFERLPERSEPFNPLNDGDVFDLGGLSVKMISCPGHTQGMMLPLIVEDRILISGDGFGEGTILSFEESTSIEEYNHHLRLFKEKYENDYDIVLRNHGTFISDKSILDEVIDCCRLILEGKDDHQKNSHDSSIYHAHAVNERNERLDGGHGNISYRTDKIRI